MSTTAPVEPGSLTCPACGTALGPYGLDAANEAACPKCHVGLRGQLFRAWWAPPAPVPTEKGMPATEGDAVCFFHPTNRAVLPCDACGRFLCSVCDMPLGSRHLCPVCLSKGMGKNKLAEIIPRRFLWARAAFLLGAVPLCGIFIFLWPILFASGGMSILIALIGWGRPGSLVRGKQRWAAIFGIIFGLLQIGVCVGFFYFIAYVSSHNK
ncbi:MAG TPA: hypothetical protein VK961_21420 [Chthoniobacter sp.]|nr:hypothetical protein [Chthoniobacter sp.]